MRRFGRVLLLMLVFPAGMLSGGCLRNRIDLCAMVPPHPECAFLDAGRADAPTDAGPTDAPEDVPTDVPSDAPSDAPTEPDAPDSP